MKNNQFTYSAFLLPPDEIMKSLELSNIGSSLSSKVQVPVDDTVMVLYRNTNVRDMNTQGMTSDSPSRDQQ